jgi:hypothetical protein
VSLTLSCLYCIVLCLSHYPACSALFCVSHTILPVLHRTALRLAGFRFINTVKKEGGIETLLFGPNAVRSSRKSSVSGGDAGKTDRGKEKGENLKGFNMSDDIKLDGSPPSSSSSFADSVMHPTRSIDEDAKGAGSGPGVGQGKGKGKDTMKSMESEDDGVVVASSDADAAASTATIASTVSGYVGSGSALFPDIDSPSGAGAGAEIESYLLADRGPFRESRKAVHFSESLEDSWEEVCVDVTPFTIKATIEEDEDDEDDVGVIPAFLGSGSDFTRNPLQESFVARQSDYDEAQRKAEALVRVSEEDEDDDFGSPSHSLSHPSTCATPEAELEFLESISASLSLSAADSPLESESEKVQLSWDLALPFLALPCLAVSLSAVLHPL